ncbi:hypothetical protein RvVAR0630_37020 [Agrobacterium vitis]|nr:hypothetical protein RvVAR0630_37020 [Agrobacterium vitis]
MFNNKKTACDKHLPDGWLPPFIRMGNRAHPHKDSAAYKIITRAENNDNEHNQSNFTEGAWRNDRGGARLCRIDGAAGRCS